MHLSLLLDLTIILLASLLASLCTKALKIPAVIGQLLVGILIGPPILGLVHSSEILTFLSEIGVILLMFLAGLEANLSLLKKFLKPSLIVAIAGVLVPLVVFYFLMQALGHNITNSVFYGLVFAATSISITVEVLQEYHKVSTDTGSIIIGAAVADDILAVLLLSFFVSMTTSSTHSGPLSLQILWQALFFAFLYLAVRYLIPKMMTWARKMPLANPAFFLALMTCFALSWTADLVGMSAIIGAFFAGIAIGQTDLVEEVTEQVEQFGHGFFIPIFFASIAFPLSFNGILPKDPLILGLTLIVVLTKLVPGYLVGRGFGFSPMDSLSIGGGMVSRGEMALIIVEVGLAEGLISSQTYSELVVVVILSTIIAPFLLNYSFKKS